MILKTKHKLLLASLATIIGTSSLITLVAANSKSEKRAELNKDVLFYEIKDDQHNDYI
ncbi:hypothetical protein [Ureaplasma diversum]|uniref:Uncharacterized protein n=1 Tax=Ureaplasma diversum NCTC 246 TaxID=1188241 RepID=A0A084EXL6_9BACT|nr:hypothetical protein [Ureaplasma diversum]KEZ22708.1 hypothetical protein UDIV_5150 [Ureaplasma diversum NCTC 246]